MTQTTWVLKATKDQPRTIIYMMITHMVVKHISSSLTRFKGALVARWRQHGIIQDIQEGKMRAIIGAFPQNLLFTSCDLLNHVYLIFIFRCRYRPCGCC